MTVFTEEVVGFGESEFGSLPFGTGIRSGTSAMAFEAVIVDATKPEGVQFESRVLESAHAEALQYIGQILDTANPEAAQFNAQILDSLDAEGVQLLAQIVETGDPEAFEFFATNLGFRCPGFGEFDFGTLPFGATACFASAAVQFESQIVDSLDAEGLEFFAGVVDFPDPEGLQYEAQIVDTAKPEGLEFEAQIVDFLNANGMQFLGQILEQLSENGVQYEAVIEDANKPEGIQFEGAVVKAEGIEWRVSLYNTSQIRILCNFDSRGAASGFGGNQWGNPVATGQSWRTNSQDPSPDFNINNVNSDTVEQVYRSLSGTTTGVNLDCDVESDPGSFMDTFAILNHNLTTGASVTLVAADNPFFSPIAKTINLTPRLDNIFHIEPDLPLTAYRYWRLQIDDPSNTDNYIEIGTILFGASAIFTTEECMTDTIRKKPQHFFDEIRTEGFSSNKNNRSLKNRITLRFESLRFDQGNWQILDEIFRTSRTSLKCLWIPTPSITDPSITERFAVFGKIAGLPDQEHNVKGTVGQDLDFVTVEFDVDEAE